MLALLDTHCYHKEKFDPDHCYRLRDKIATRLTWLKEDNSLQASVLSGINPDPFKSRHDCLQKPNIGHPSDYSIGGSLIDLQAGSG